MSAQTWTYSGDPRSSILDEVRFLVADTDTNDRQIADEEILYLIDIRASTYSVASGVCQAIAAKYARDVSKHVGDLKIEAQARQQHYNDLADRYASQAGEAGLSMYALSAPYAGGISQSDRDVQIADSDRVDPSFSVGGMDYPGTSRSGEQSSSAFMP